jgi:hypothetical protein
MCSTRVATKHCAALVVSALLLIAKTGLATAQQDGQEATQTDRTEQTQRREGEAILALADAALAGKRVPGDFSVQWHNDFLKAQRGTFIPFTLTIDSSRFTRPAALIYIRAVRRETTAAGATATESQPRRQNGRKDASAGVQFPVDAIFPVELQPEPGQLAHVRRGFSLDPGDYDIYVVLRERVEPAGRRTQPRAAVLKQPLSVPDFWSTGLTTSSIIVAESLRMLNRPVPAEELVERPYAIGQSDITPAADRRFRADEELIVVLLVYNPAVTPERKFDIQVEYHLYRKLGNGTGTDRSGLATAAHPPEQEGEKYLNHTDPQRFNPGTLGTQFDPAAGHPVMAGQGIPLAGFRDGNYRLAIRVIDLISGESITRDVQFTVGS